jgi:hypothetical protein
VEHDTHDSGVTLAELLAAYPLATDLGLGQPMEHLLRSWRIASQVGANVGLPRRGAGVVVLRGDALVGGLRRRRSRGGRFVR